VDAVEALADGLNSESNNWHVAYTSIFHGAGSTGRVTSEAGDAAKYLKGDGTWSDTPAASYGTTDSTGYRGDWGNVVSGRVDNLITSTQTLNTATNSIQLDLDKLEANAVTNPVGANINMNGREFVQGPGDFMFYAHLGSDLASTGATHQTIILDTETLDNNNCFASSTFTPTNSGWYMINACVSKNVATNISTMYVYISRNGDTGTGKTNTFILSALNIQSVATNNNSYFTGSALVYCNGVGDFVQLKSYMSGPANDVIQAKSTYMQGYFIHK
jgi:hypothetical protein